MRTFIALSYFNKYELERLVLDAESIESVGAVDRDSDAQIRAHTPEQYEGESFTKLRTKSGAEYVLNCDEEYVLEKLGAEFIPIE